MNKTQIVRNMALRFGPQLADNNMREQDALKGYYDLLRDIDSYCCDMSCKSDGTYDKACLEFWQKYLAPLREEIEEIISDELNHSTMLHELMIKFGQVKEAKV